MSHLGLTLLKQCLQSLLGGSALVVVADDQDDVIPVEFAHHVKPNMGLMGIGGDGSQEGQVDALNRRRRQR